MNTKPKIVFKNQPVLSEHEADSKFNERRIGLIPHIENFVSKHPRFQYKEINITFSDKGISSLVCIIETATEKVVLKIPLSLSHSIGEGKFLKVWKDAGIKVPEVFEEGIINRHQYILMEFIDAPILGDKYSDSELIEKGIYTEMGATLKKMHTTRVRGFGRLIDEKPEIPEFMDWISSEDIQKRFQYVKEHNLLNEISELTDKAIDILKIHTDKEDSSYCHEDFGASNIFATNPITVFDPNPRFNNRYLDLGRTLYNHIAIGIYPHELINGYFGNERCNEKVLYASFIINCYYKFPYAHKTKRLETIENIKKYLIENKHLLD